MTNLKKVFPELKYVKVQEIPKLKMRDRQAWATRSEDQDA